MRRLIAAAAIALLAGSAAAAEGSWRKLQRSSPDAGLMCLVLDLDPESWLRADYSIPVYQRPSPDAPILGPAGGVQLATNPMHTANGFIAVVRSDAAVGWLDQRYVKQYVPGSCVDLMTGKTRLKDQ
jgi:hypothetical protein